MAIAHEFESIAIRKEAIVKGYPGGLEGFRANWAVGSYVEDDHLARIGSMGPATTESILVDLERAGLRWLDDLAITASGVPSTEGFWLATGKIGMVDAFWLASRPPGDLFAPISGEMYWVDEPAAEEFLTAPPALVSAMVSRRAGLTTRVVFARGRSVVDADIQVSDAGHHQVLVVLQPRHGRVAGFDPDETLMLDLDGALVAAGAQAIR